jgi:hypothetical protein
VKVITLRFEIEDDQLKEFLARDDVRGDLNEWAFGELTQNEGLGTLIECTIADAKDES